MICSELKKDNKDKDKDKDKDNGKQNDDSTTNKVSSKLSLSVRSATRHHENMNKFKPQNLLDGSSSSDQNSNTCYHSQGDQGHNQKIVFNINSGTVAVDRTEILLRNNFEPSLDSKSVASCCFLRYFRPDLCCSDPCQSAGVQRQQLSALHSHIRPPSDQRRHHDLRLRGQEGQLSHSGQEQEPPRLVRPARGLRIHCVRLLVNTDQSEPPGFMVMG